MGDQSLAENVSILFRQTSNNAMMAFGLINGESVDHDHVEILVPEARICSSGGLCTPQQDTEQSRLSGDARSQSESTDPWYGNRRKTQERVPEVPMRQTYRLLPPATYLFC